MHLLHELKSMIVSMHAGEGKSWPVQKSQPTEARHASMHALYGRSDMLCIVRHSRRTWPRYPTNQMTLIWRNLGWLDWLHTCKVRPAVASLYSSRRLADMTQISPIYQLGRVAKDGKVTRTTLCRHGSTRIAFVTAVAQASTSSTLFKKIFNHKGRRCSCLLT